MLVLSLMLRDPDSYIIIDGRIKVYICGVYSNRVALGIEAPREINIDRSARQHPKAEDARRLT